jgi:hypothetical protein
MNDKQKTMVEKKNQVLYMISQQDTNRVKTDFPGCTRGMHRIYLVQEQNRSER